MFVFALALLLLGAFALCYTACCMKRALIQFGMGACVAVVFASCKSSDGDGFSSYETATPYSEYEVAEDTIPPWLIDDPEVRAQVSAGPTTASRNTYAIPEPGTATASTGGSFSMSQGQTVSTNEMAAVEIPIAAPPVTTSAATSSSSSSSSTASKPKTTSKSLNPPKRLSTPTLVTYKVRPGDNLSVIAARSGTTVSAIRKASGITGSLIHPGQTIKVPYTPKGYKASSSTSSSRGGSYTVKSGDTIDSIARRHGLGFKQVLSANKMSEAQARKLQPGQKIIIP